MRTRLIDSLPLTETFIRYYSVDSFAAVWGALLLRCGVVWRPRSAAGLVWNLGRGGGWRNRNNHNWQCFFLAGGNALQFAKKKMCPSVHGRD